jgi:hypothetical protein
MTGFSEEVSVDAGGVSLNGEMPMASDGISVTEKY